MEGMAMGRFLIDVAGQRGINDLQRRHQPDPDHHLTGAVRAQKNENAMAKNVQRKTAQRTAMAQVSASFATRATPSRTPRSPAIGTCITGPSRSAGMGLRCQPVR